ncbi:hypothetical protein OG727_18210 [Streptomyces caniferus]|uniref:Uncharacterized protein n=1 Tax=Streptomyces caniferus TaxID=285557 RepID=A0ABZ1VPS8_9ACTN|nr:hypothetical protein [Streptomyces caniferus]
MARDRRSNSDAAKDRRLTGQLQHSAHNYCNSENADSDFASTVLNGCLTTSPKDYPPAGHGYPSDES